MGIQNAWVDASFKALSTEPPKFGGAAIIAPAGTSKNIQEIITFDYQNYDQGTQQWLEKNVDLIELINAVLTLEHVPENSLRNLMTDSQSALNILQAVQSDMFYNMSFATPYIQKIRDNMPNAVQKQNWLKRLQQNLENTLSYDRIYNAIARHFTAEIRYNHDSSDNMFLAHEFSRIAYQPMELANSWQHKLLRNQNPSFQHVTVNNGYPNYVL